MELNNIRKTSGKIAKIRFNIGLIIIGIFFSLIGGLLLYRNLSKNIVYIPVEAKIIETHGYTNSDSNDIDTEIEYNVDGVIYKAIWSVPYKEAKVENVITIYVEDGNPNNISSSINGGKVILFITTSIGLLCITIGIISLIKNKKNKNFDSLNQVNYQNIDEDLIEEIKNNNEEFNNYIFYFTGKLNQSYVLENEGKEKIISLNCEKIGFFTKSKYKFINHLTLTKKEYLVSHTITHSYSSNMFDVPTDSSFKINGVDAFQMIGKMGYSIKLKIEGLKLNFDIFHFGVFVGSIKSSGVNTKEKTKNYGKLGDIPVNGIYKVETKESELDSIALIAFIVSRVEFF